MSDCWAASLGNCSDKISREHVITAGLFLSDRIFVQGLPWCKDELKEIGLSAFTKKILCIQHNNDLSMVDNAGIATINVFREATRLSNLRVEQEKKNRRIVRFHIDGVALERWFLKTFINIAYQRAYPVSDDSAPRWRPPQSLVEIAFGRRWFEPRSGLYLTGSVGDSIVSDDRINVVTFTDASDQLVGAQFNFRGFGFLLYLEQQGLRDRITLERSPGVSRSVQPLYHPNKIRVMVGARLSHLIEFRWRK